ncbi:MAG TPA: GldG family protein [Planctomycetota bacterium]|nr:GldG family protein [Planctomycetota bacterium]
MEVKQIDRPPRATFGGVRRWTGRIHLVIGLILSVYILLLSNIVAFRHPTRIDLTEERLNSISRATLDKLRMVTEEIHVIIPTFLQKDNNEHLAYYEVLGRARLLLNEYIAAQPLLKPIEVDVFARPDRWEQVKTEYKLTQTQFNRFIFIAGADRDLRQTVTPQDLATFDTSRDVRMAPPGVKRFRGEKALTDAITRLIERKRTPIYFTQDKEELSLLPREGVGAGVGGLGALEREVETEGFEAKPFSIGSAKEVPADCRALVIAAPFLPYSRSDLQVIERYLERGGRLLVALGAARTGLEDLLEGWGIKVLPGKVQARTVTARRWVGTVEVSVREVEPHPVTKVFREVPRFEVQLLNPHALAASHRGPLLDVNPVLAVRSTPGGEAFFFVPERKSEPAQEGTHLLALSAEQRQPTNPPPNFQRKETRILVVGGGSFLTSQYFEQYSHRDFLLNAIAWLIGEEEKATTGGQDWAERTIKLDASIQRFLFWVPIVVIPGLVLLLGACVYWVRRT